MHYVWARPMHNAKKNYKNLIICSARWTHAKRKKNKKNKRGQTQTPKYYL